MSRLCHMTLQRNLRYAQNMPLHDIHVRIMFSLFFHIQCIMARFRELLASLGFASSNNYLSSTMYIRCMAKPSQHRHASRGLRTAGSDREARSRKTPLPNSRKLNLS